SASCDSRGRTSAIRRRCPGPSSGHRWTPDRHGPVRPAARPPPCRRRQSRSVEDPCAFPCLPLFGVFDPCSLVNPCVASNMAMAARAIIIGLVMLMGLLGGSGQGRAAPADYPTEALADYVFACMASNGQTQENLRRCSCSIDVIAAAFPYDKYVQAETILSMS